MEEKNQIESQKSKWDTYSLVHILQNPPEEFIGIAAQNYLPDIQANVESISRKEYEDMPAPLHIEYGFADSPLGKCMIATTAKGICAFQFVDGNEEEIVCSFKERWLGSTFELNDSKAKENVVSLFTRPGKSVTLFLKGTLLQIKVWETLLSIPNGDTLTYSQLAGLAGNPRAIRAVASAVAQNPIGLLIPCHRITRHDGTIGQYHWGSKRKALFIFLEKRIATLQM